MSEVGNASSGIAFFHHAGDGELGELLHGKSSQLLLRFFLQARHIDLDGIAAVRADPGRYSFDDMNQRDRCAVVCGEGLHKGNRAVAARREIDGKKYMAETHLSRLLLGGTSTITTTKKGAEDEYRWPKCAGRRGTP